MTRELKLKKRGKVWWIINMPIYYVDGEPFTECGPYTTKEEAKADQEGMQRTLEKIGYEDEKKPVEQQRSQSKGSTATIEAQRRKVVKKKKTLSKGVVVKKKRKAAISPDAGMW